jgi:hypothetical protein
MQHHIKTLVKHFFHKESLTEVTVNQLQQFIDDYPYSAVGQLLLAKKLRDTGAQNFEEHSGKSSLYFHDPVWAGWILRQATAESAAEILNEPEPVKETPHFVFDQIIANEPVLENEETPPWDESQIEPIHEEPVVENVAPVTEAPVQIENLPVEETAKTGDHIHDQAEEMPEEPAEETPPPVLPDSLIKPSSFSSEIPKEQSTDNGDLNFEPYHTIDYFASLGIKLKPEELAKDKLGQQLKSFTDWLRSMKKIAPVQGGEKMAEVDELTDKSIQRIAEFSNEAKEIITEAMAEVWAKQGHKEKAVQIYEKLSLLNPSKSHYFAARIEALKA